MVKKPIQSTKMSGHTLIEIMIGLTLGLFIMLMCLSVFTTAMRFWAMQQELAQIQENARLLQGLLGRVVKEAGLLGCKGVSAMALLKTDAFIPTSFYQKVKTNTDLLCIQPTDKPHPVIYYVGNTSRFNNKGEPIFALYALDLNDRHYDVMEGVEDMKVTMDIQGRRVSIKVLLSPIYHNSHRKEWWTYAFNL